MEGEAMEGKEEKKFYLHIGGKNVEVSEEIYRVYKSSEEKERYFMKRLKKGRFVADPEGRGSVYIPGREKSFEKLFRSGDRGQGGESLSFGRAGSRLGDTLRRGADAGRGTVLSGEDGAGGVRCLTYGKDHAQPPETGHSQEAEGAHAGRIEKFFRKKRTNSPSGHRT